MHEHYHDPRFECTIKKLERDSYGGPCADAGALSDAASRAECGSADECECASRDADGRRAAAIDWA